jgi:perosamine synthetase
MTEWIPLAEPELSGNELAYVTECIQTGWLTAQGTYVRRFETLFGATVQQPYAISVANGTLAVHLALLALEIGPGDEVIVPTLSYVASASPILFCGATPVFVDIDPQTWNLDPAAVEAAITPRTKAIMVVHLYGTPADMTRLGDIAERHNIAIIEDAAECHGGTWDGKPIGSFGRVAAFSFYANKVITTGEGGMCVTSDAELDARMRLLRGQGMDLSRQYWHPIVGYNYRMTNIQAAMGVAQLERIETFFAQRRHIVAQYQALMADWDDVSWPIMPAQGTGVPWLFTVRLLGLSREQRDTVIVQLKDHGVETRPIFWPIHRFPPYQPYVHSEFPIAETISAEGISLPTHPKLTDAQIERVVVALREVVTGLKKLA